MVSIFQTFPAVADPTSPLVPPPAPTPSSTPPLISSPLPSLAPQEVIPLPSMGKFYYDFLYQDLSICEQLTNIVKFTLLTNMVMHVIQHNVFFC